MMSQPNDLYYQRSEVSNSDLTTLKYKLYPALCHTTEAQKNKAFHLGTLVDAFITEISKVNFYRLTVDDEEYTQEEFDWGMKMRQAILRESKRDKFLEIVLNTAETQKFMTVEDQYFEYSCFNFSLATRCKWDWWLDKFGGDLKSTVATTQEQFENCVDYFDWDRSRAWYMDIAHSLDPNLGNKDFIYAISKKNFKVFKKTITRGDALYTRGRDKYMDLAFKYWTLS